MKMDYDEVYDAVKNACEDSLKKDASEEDNSEAPKSIFPIKPFSALDIDDNPVEVLGVACMGDWFEFIVMRRHPDEGNAIGVGLEHRVWNEGAVPALKATE